jgi:hypothetical protein
MNLVAIQANVQWKAFRDNATKAWVAVCEPLKITVEADSWSALHETISDSLDLLFRDLIKSGELDGFLKEMGWRLLTPLPAKPQNARFDVPYRLVPTGRARHGYAQAAMCN